MIDFSEEIARGIEAERLLEHPLLIAAFRQVHGELIHAWNTSPPRDTEGRETIYMGVMMLQKLEAAIRQHVVTGKMAKIQLHGMTEENRVQH